MRHKEMRVGAFRLRELPVPSTDDMAFNTFGKIMEAWWTAVGLE